MHVREVRRARTSQAVWMKSSWSVRSPAEHNGRDGTEAMVLPCTYLPQMHDSSNEPALRIAVLGAGYVGSALATAAQASGHEVWAVRRSAVEPQAGGVHWLRGDLATALPAGIPSALDAVVLTVAPSGGRGYGDTYPPAARSALSLAKASGARALIYTSSTGVYGGVDGSWVTEQSERRGTGDGNHALIAAEDLLLGGDAPGTMVLRVAGIYGPGRDPRARLRNPALLPRRGEYWMNLAHRDDIVSAALHLLRDPQSGVLNVCDSAPALAADVCRWLTTAAGDDASRLTFSGDVPLTRSNQRVSNATLISTGWTPQYPDFRDGFTHGL